MKTRIKISFTIAIVLLGSLLMDGGFALLNIANNAAFYAGISVLLLIFVLLPTLLWRIWRNKDEVKEISIT